MPENGKDAKEEDANENDVDSFDAKSLYCQKYSRHLSGDNVKCPLPNDYCKTRTACIINTLSKKV
jgi:hypothetical protein